MKLIIQIPCYNEEDTLPVTLRDLPKEIKGIDKIETLIIDDGSKDKTAEIAKENGVNHVVKLAAHQGLAKCFYTGLYNCLQQGADIIVNTDADNQYQGSCIKDLVRPILEQKADVVLGVRDFRHMSKFKVLLEKLGSMIVSRLTGIEIKDAVSGFRAYTKEAAMSLSPFTTFTYTLDSLVQIAEKNLVITNISIKTNKVGRKSKLITSLFKYIEITTIGFINVLFLFQPLRFFAWGGIIFTIAGLSLGVRFLFYYFNSGGKGHIQSLILMAIFIILGFLLFALGTLSHLIATNRRLAETILKEIRYKNYPLRP
jgi:glycosyltransferase involved in cell wall biosynthesis